MAKMSKEAIERRGKRLYPESQSLAIDRAFDAKTVFSPDKAGDWEKWRKNKNTTDMRHFDTTDRKEPSPASLRRKIVGKDGYVEQEPDRFVHPRHDSRKKLETVKNEMTDYDNFKRAVDKAWGTDKKGLANLILNMTERDYKALFETQVVQGWVEDNRIPFLVNFVSKKYKVEPVRASRVVTGLSARVRKRLYTQALKSKLPRIQTKKRRIVPKRRGKRRNIRWSVQEQNIIRANRRLPSYRLAELMRRVGYNRSEASIKAQLKKL